MKKFYSLLLAVVAGCFGANADNMSFTVQGQPVQNGDRVNITEFFETGRFTQYNPHLMLLPTVSGEAKVTVEFTKDNTEPKLDDDWMYGGNMTVSVCSFGNCTIVFPGRSTEKQDQVTAGNEVNMQIELVIDLGEEQAIEDMLIDDEFTFKCELGGETFNLTFYAFQAPANVEGLTTDNTPAAYYDLQGRRVAAPEHGIYICRQGAKTTKVLK